MDQPLVDFNVTKLLKEMSVKFEDTIKSCKFGDHYVNCSHYFATVLTTEGFCYTFNMISSYQIYKPEVSRDLFCQNELNYHSDWNIDHGYLDQKYESYPFRAFGAGIYSGLSLNLALNESDFDYWCTNGFQGFKVLIHSPADIPRIGKSYFYIPLNSDAVISLDPNVMSASSGLQQYPQSK